MKQKKLQHKSFLDKEKKKGKKEKKERQKEKQEKLKERGLKRIVPINQCL